MEAHADCSTPPVVAPGGVPLKLSEGGGWDGSPNHLSKANSVIIGPRAPSRWSPVLVAMRPTSDVHNAMPKSADRTIGPAACADPKPIGECRTSWRGQLKVLSSMCFSLWTSTKQPLKN